MLKDSRKDSRVFYFTVLNVLACFSVICLHTNGVFWSFPKGRLWLSSNFIETFFYFAVPIFFMLSGATLLDYRNRYTTTTFLKKRVEKTVLPFIIWSIIAILLHVIRQPQDINYSIVWLINAVLSCKYMYIYWFFIALFSVYAFVPILSVVDRKIFKYAIVVGITCVSILPLLFKFIGLYYPYGTPEENFHSAGTPEENFHSAYVLYLILGYYLANNDVSKYEKIIYLFGFFGWAIHFYGTSILSISHIDTTFIGYLKFPAVLHSIAIFVFIKQINWNTIICNNPWIETILNFFSQYTFGIYLVHIYFVLYMPEIFHFSNASIIWRMFGPCVVFFLSAVVVYILRKIPVIKLIVP